MPEPLLKIQNLSLSFGDKIVLQDFNLTIHKEEIVTLVGASGSGKSSLLKILTGIYTPRENSIIFKGLLKQSISFLTQEDLLLPWRTVLENVLLPFELGKNPLKGSEAEAIDFLTELGLKDSIHCHPEQLSGGMRQRVCLARALLQKRPLLLLDEPFDSLDIILREQIYEIIKNVKKRQKSSILMVTHDFHDALALSDRIVVLRHGRIFKEWFVEKKHHEKILDEIRSIMLAPLK